MKKLFLMAFPVLVLFVLLGQVRAEDRASDSYVDTMVALGRHEYGPAVHQLKLLAEQGQPKAPLILGTLYATGKGVPRDYVEAVNWFRKGAEQGDADAAYSLGYMYGKGLGVHQNRVEAARWQLWAAEEGHPGAQYSTAGRYVIGSGLRRDYTTAATWYHRAAEQGIVEAQVILGTMLALGKGVPRDNVAAYSWATIAVAARISKQSRDDAVALRRSLAQSMTREQVASAEKMANDWKPKSERLARQPK
jgi:uncharacterized protein